MGATMYKAVQEFRLNAEGVQDSITVRPGTVFSYDGLTVEITCGDGAVKKIVNHSFGKTMGDWYVPVKESSEASKQAAVPDNNKTLSAKAVVDSSAIASDNIVDLVTKYEEKSGLRDKGPVIINEDASIVKQTQKTAGESPIKNISGVMVAEDSEVGQRTVVHRDSMVSKKTAYNPTVDSSEPRKQREIIRDSEGVVVKKTTERAIFINDFTKPGFEREAMKVISADKAPIVDENVVKERVYEGPATTKVTGSTTQAQVVSKSHASAEDAVKAAADRKADRIKQITEVDSQEGVVVSKVRKDEVPETKGGFTSKLSVGKTPEESIGEATVGGNVSGDVDGIVGGEATTSSGGNINAVDASAEDDSNVDIGDILDDMK